MSGERVSVVLCSYNQAEYLEHAIKSVLEQSWADTELVVVDNGSRDESPVICEKFRGHPQVKLLLHQENAAVTKRMNEAVDACTGDFVSFLYSDDYYLPEKNAHQVALLRAVPSVGVTYSPGWRLNAHSGQRWRDPSLTVSGRVLRAMFREHERGGVNPISPLVRRACLREFRFDESLFIEGEFLFFRLASRYEYLFDPEPLVVMRDHDTNVGRALRPNIQRLMVALDHFRASGECPADHLDDMAIFRAKVLRNASWQAIRVLDDPAFAVECLRGAARSGLRQSLHVRSLATGALLLCPPAVRRQVVRGLDAVRRRRGHSNYVASLDDVDNVAP